MTTRKPYWIAWGRSDRERQGFATITEAATAARDLIAAKTATVITLADCSATGMGPEIRLGIYSPHGFDPDPAFVRETLDRLQALLDADRSSKLAPLTPARTTLTLKRTGIGALVQRWRKEVERKQ